MDEELTKLVEEKINPQLFVGELEEEDEDTEEQEPALAGHMLNEEF